MLITPMVIVTRYVADHPNCTMADLEDHIINGADLNGAQASIKRAIDAGLIQRSIASDPVTLTATARGFRAIG
jgi:predicted MarR family transcription regulator